MSMYWNIPFERIGIIGEISELLCVLILTDTFAEVCMVKVLSNYLEIVLQTSERARTHTYTHFTAV